MSEGAIDRFIFGTGVLAGASSGLSEDAWQRADHFLARSLAALAEHHPDPVVSGELARLAELLAPDEDAPIPAHRQPPRLGLAPARLPCTCPRDVPANEGAPARSCPVHGGGRGE